MTKLFLAATSAGSAHICLRCLTAALLILTTGAIAEKALAGVLEDVQERGYVRCGVNDLPGYAHVMADGSWQGFQVDFCRAVAAAVVKDPLATEPVVLFTEDRFRGVAQGEADLTHANVTWTLTRERTKDVAFTAVMEYDGQGFITHTDSGIERMTDTVGRKVKLCVVKNTTTEANIRDYDRQHALGLEITPFGTIDATWNAFLGRQCDLMVSDRTPLYLNRNARTAVPGSTRILPEVISREPLTPVVKANEPSWESIVRWVRHVLVIAEEKGVTMANVERLARDSSDPEVRRLLGVEPGMGALLGLDDLWARRIIEAVGNYGEMFDRNLGAGSPFGMERGLNALWLDGGLLYAPPLR